MNFQDGLNASAVCQKSARSLLLKAKTVAAIEIHPPSEISSPDPLPSSLPERTAIASNCSSTWYSPLLPSVQSSRLFGQLGSNTNITARKALASFCKTSRSAELPIVGRIMRSSITDDNHGET
ncbi:hypothetical protein ACHAWO_013694 [Cyclotella atomus]|uniref:Uncharacterized protein n=1 Tax=Cyclotella atomus TaxID=382360 RepID=A0ABD3NN01_9STRA